MPCSRISSRDSGGQAKRDEQRGKTAQATATRRRPSFGLWADPVLLLALLALWIALALVFNGEPEIDQRVSSMFFAVQPCAQGSQASACGIFPAPANAVLQAVRNFFHYLPIVVAIVVAAILARDLAAGRGFGDGHVRFTATALAAYLASARA